MALTKAYTVEFGMDPTTGFVHRRVETTQVVVRSKFGHQHQWDLFTVDEEEAVRGAVGHMVSIYRDKPEDVEVIDIRKNDAEAFEINRM